MLRKRTIIIRLLLSICCGPFAVFVSCREDSQKSIANLDCSQAQRITLHADVVPDIADRFPAARHFYVYHDRILVTINRPSNGDAFVHLSELESGKALASAILYGNGPAEMLSVSEHLRDGVLYLKDYVKKRIVALPIDSLIQKPSFRASSFLDYSQYGKFPFVTFWDDQKMLAENPYCFSNKEYGIDNHDPERILILDTGASSRLKRKNYRFETYNVSQGFILPSRRHGRIIYASMNEPVLEVYDSVGNRIKAFLGPKKMDIPYRITDGRYVSFDQKVPFAFQAPCLEEDAVFIVFIGDFLTDDHTEKDIMHSTILELDWQGNLQCIYDAPVFLSTLSRTSDGVFYGTGYDKDGRTVLWELKK